LHRQVYEAEIKMISSNQGGRLKLTDNYKQTRTKKGEKQKKRTKPESKENVKEKRIKKGESDQGIPSDKECYHIRVGDE
jgi:hypothetical protein